jgi:hypothetical protein
MLKTLAHLFTPQSSNNYKAKTLHISSLSVFMLIIMLSQIVLSLIAQTIPGVLGIASSITSQELIQLTNLKRQEHDLSALNLNSTLSQIAGLKGADMIANNYWAHTSPEGKTPWNFFTQGGYRYLYAGENLARDFPDPNSVVNAWMNSSTHRDNILSTRYKEVGIAVIHDTFQGQSTTLVIQMFGTPASAALPDRVGQINQVAEIADAVIAEVIPEQEIAGVASQLPFLSSFQLTKAMSISLTVILLATIIIDTIFITRKKIIRLSGKGLAHLLFLGILLILLLGVQPGMIL